MVISLYSPDQSYDAVFLSNYASINLVDPITRVPGVGNLTIVGQRDYAMRLWLRPDKLAKLGLTAEDITNVIKEQNVQAPAGQIGQPPAKAGVDFQYTVNVKGRLATAKEFESIVVRTLPDGSILRIKDVARTELAAQDYNNIGRLNGVPATVLEVYQLPGANALQTADGVRRTVERLAAYFPPGLAYEVSTDNTRFITASLEEVIHTFFEALILVALVVFLFLGTVRATLIPMLAVPVSIVGTFAAFVPLGFSINTLTLFGLVLAIGIVVDDAIVVVEAVEHHIEQGRPPFEAAQRAMAASLPDLFQPYPVPQVHATVINLDRLGEGPLVNFNLYRYRGQSRVMDLAGILEYVRNEVPYPLSIQVGGFEDRDYPFTSRGERPYARAFSIQRTIATVIGWPAQAVAVAGRGQAAPVLEYPPALADLRVKLEEFNLLHTYHRLDGERDNDFYFRIGVLARPLSGSDREAVEASVRRELSVIGPHFISLSADDLYFASYVDESLPLDSTASWAATDPQLTPELLETLYR
jgi:hypothetical protein